MKITFALIPALLLFAGGRVDAALSLTLDFDNVIVGQDINNFLPAGISIVGAVYDTDFDAFGSSIPGTEHWQTDNTAPPVGAVDPTTFGWNSAPSGPLALDATGGVVMIRLSPPQSVDQFKLTPVGPFGDPAAQVLFLDAGGLPIGSPLVVNQTSQTPVQTNRGGAMISSVLLPSGMYDNVIFTPVPEPGMVALLGLYGLVVTGRRRRQS